MSRRAPRAPRTPLGHRPGFVVGLLRNKLDFENPNTQSAVTLTASFGEGAALAVLLSAYHHRRTSACRATFPPPVVSQVRELSGLLPGPDGIRALGAMGFTTIVVHHPRKGQDRSYAKGFEAATHTGLLQRIHGDDFMTAYTIGPGDHR